MRKLEMSVPASAIQQPETRTVPRIGRREPETWMAWLKRHLYDQANKGIAVTNKDQSATYFRVPWVAIGIMVVLGGMWWNSYNARKDAESAMAAQNATLMEKINGLTTLVNAQNNQLTTMTANINAANAAAENARQSAEMANDNFYQVQLVLAQRGISVKERQ